MTEDGVRRVPAAGIQDFCVRVFEQLGVSAADARITADVLVAADLRGVASHGVAHLRRYVDAMRVGVINARPTEVVVAESAVTATLDAGAGLGPPVSSRAMQLAIRKAQALGAGFVSVRNSNHHGIAGYYAMMALPHDCVGLVMTNASTKVAPTFARQAVLGTNPISIAAPAGRRDAFVLDMATSAVALGKVEIADQLGRDIPSGWAIDPEGKPATDSHRALDELRRGVGGGLLPLGGQGETTGGHKGYGLAVAVEVFTALLSGAAFASTTYPRSADGAHLPANLGHFFGAWRIDAFRPVDEFKAAMDEMQALLVNAPKSEGQPRIYVHGDKERAAAEENTRLGVRVNDRVAAELEGVARELGIGGAW